MCTESPLRRNLKAGERSRIEQGKKPGKGVVSAWSRRELWCMTGTALWGASCFCIPYQSKLAAGCSIFGWAVSCPLKPVFPERHSSELFATTGGWMGTEAWCNNVWCLLCAYCLRVQHSYKHFTRIICVNSMRYMITFLHLKFKETEAQTN